MSIGKSQYSIQGQYIPKSESFTLAINYCICRHPKGLALILKLTSKANGLSFRVIFIKYIGIIHTIEIKLNE